MAAMKYKQTFEINSVYEEIEKASDSFTYKQVCYLLSSFK